MKEDSFNKNTISIRPIIRKDANILLELNNDISIQNSVVGNPKKVTFEQQLEWMRNIKDEKNIVRFMIDYNEETVGTLIISSIDKNNKTATMNIKILPISQGKGIGTKALDIACNYAFNQMDIYCLEAHILKDNIASQRLFSKAGFKKEGVLRSRVVKNGVRCDLISYSLLKTDIVKE